MNQRVKIKMFEIFKLEFHNFLNTNKILANHLKKAEKAEKDEMKVISSEIENLKNYFMQQRADEFNTSYSNLIASLKKYFNSVIIKEEDAAILYLFRDEKDLEKIKTESEQLILKLEKHQNLKKLVEEELKNITEEISKLKDELKTLRNLAKDQGRDKEKLRDGFFIDFGKEQKERVAIRILKRSAKKEKKTVVRLKSQHNGAIKLLSSKDQNQVIENKLTELMSEENKNEKELITIIDRVIKATFFIVKYAVYHYFEMSKLITNAEGMIEAVKSHGGHDKLTNNLQSLINELHKHIKEQTETEYITFKKIRRQAQKN